MAASPHTDHVFAGSVPEIYDAHLVPMIFQPYADDLATRVAARRVRRVLEVAAGTGALTRALAKTLPGDVEIVATDLNQPMLDRAAATGTARPVTWRLADALQLPFDDDSFDAVVCQFGLMFFPDKAKAHAEFRRVLRRGGTLFFNVWDRIEKNDLFAIANATVGEMFPDDPPRFLARTPYGYFEFGTIRDDLGRGGFAAPDIVTVPARSRADRAATAAIAMCQGTPLRNELVAREHDCLGRATRAVTAAIASRFGDGPIDAAMSAHVVTVAA
jgi:SAM-dependent methyltransferase